MHFFLNFENSLSLLSFPKSAADERIFVPSFVNYHDNGKSVRDPIILLIIRAIKLREKASILNYILQRENKYQENSFVPVI